MLPIGTSWRFSTLRSWLSQWSYDESRAHGEKNAARISRPVLVINNKADLACTPSHAHRLFNAVASKDKEIVEIDGALVVAGEAGGPTAADAAGET